MISPAFPQDRKSAWKRIPLWVYILLGTPVLAALAGGMWLAVVVRGAMQGTTCLANAKQLSTVVLQYAGDYDDRLPVAVRWVDATFEYTKHREVFTCPSAPGDGPGVYGYAFNASLSGRRVASMTDASHVLMLYDSKNFARNAADLITSLPVPGRHHSTDSVGFLDGHAKAADPALANQWKATTSAATGKGK